MKFRNKISPIRMHGGQIALTERKLLNSIMHNRYKLFYAGYLATLFGYCYSDVKFLRIKLWKIVKMVINSSFFGLPIISLLKNLSLSQKIKNLLDNKIFSASRKKISESNKITPFFYFKFTPVKTIFLRRFSHLNFSNIIPHMWNTQNTPKNSIILMNDFTHRRQQSVKWFSTHI